MVEVMKMYGLTCMQDDRFKFYHLAYGDMLIKFDTINKNVKIYTYNDKIIPINNVSKIVKNKRYLILFRGNKINFAINDTCYIGKFYYNLKEVETYSMFRKLQRKGVKFR